MLAQDDLEQASIDRGWNGIDSLGEFSWVGRIVRDQHDDVPFGIRNILEEKLGIVSKSIVLDCTPPILICCQGSHIHHLVLKIACPKTMN